MSKIGFNLHSDDGDMKWTISQLDVAGNVDIWAGRAPSLIWVKDASQFEWFIYVCSKPSAEVTIDFALLRDDDFEK